MHGKGVFALRDIAKGETVIEYKGEVISWEEALRRHFSLTMREAEVLVWIAKGKSNRDIAEILASLGAESDCLSVTRSRARNARFFGDNGNDGF